MSFNNLINATKRKVSPLIWGAPIIIFIMSFTAAPVTAASFDTQINQLKQNSSRAKQRKNQLSREAVSLTGTVRALQSEIAALDSQINQTQGKVATLKQNIAEAEAELAQQRVLLGLNVREMYTNQDITTLEMLASSKNFSHFVDQEQYRTNLQEKIDAATNRIEKLTAELGLEKKSIENLLGDQRAMQDHLSARRDESAELLGLNQEQQQDFQNRLNANNARIAELRNRQVGENSKGFVNRPKAARINVVAGEGYPWASTPFPNTLPDPWGMYKRQCVSYTAWKVASSGRHMPYWGGRGNAKLWDDNARRAGIPVGYSPHAGDVAISNAGAYGHAMYVEAVHGDGTITISQYNAGWDGAYSEGRRRSAGLTFIHF